MSRQIERALLDVSEERRVEVGLGVARALIDRLGELVTADPSARPVDPARVLRAAVENAGVGGAISTLNPPPLGTGRYQANA